MNLCKCQKGILEEIISMFENGDNTLNNNIAKIFKTLKKDLEKPCTCQEKKEEPQKEFDKRRKSLIEPIAEEDIRENSLCVVSLNESNGRHYIRMATANDGLVKLLVYSKFGAKKGQTMINVPSDKGDVCFEMKKECDHLVGVAGWVDEYCFDGDQVMMSDLLGTNTLTKWVTCLDDVKIRFYCCPKKGCGAPIDWDSIKESLKQSNEKE